MSDNSEEKTEDASKRKLKKQREEGSLPRTSDMTTMLNVVVGLIIFVSTASLILTEYRIMFDAIFIAMRQPWDLSQVVGINALIKGVLGMTITIVAGTLSIMLLVTVLYQGGLPFSMKPLLPDFNRHCS